MSAMPSGETGGVFRLPLDELTRREAPTRHGGVELRSRPGAHDSPRPAVIGVSPRAESLSRLPDVLGYFADGFVLPMPEGPAEKAAEVIEDLVGELFADRPVVLFGLSLGADACLAVRAAGVSRVVAVEPVAAVPDDLPAPVELILGGRLGGKTPSRVDAETRRGLAGRRKLRLHVVPEAGHQVQSEAPRAVIEVLLEACRRAAARHDYDARRLDEPLLEATPLGAPRVAYWGPEEATFGAAYLARSPQSRVGPGPCDVLVLGAPPPADRLGELVASVASDGLIVARWPAAAAEGFAAAEPADDSGSGVVRLRRTASERLRLELITYAPLLMDVRTRLPAQALRSDPDLLVAYHPAPAGLPPMPRDAPKVAVLQRPADPDMARWGRFMAAAVEQGWVVVIEIDDHPRVIAQTHGRADEAVDLARYGYAHAIQTSTEPLAELFRGLNGEVAVFPNAVFELPAFHAEKPQRVVYGGVQRGAFPAAVARALAPVTERHPDVEFAVVGDREVFDALPTTRKALHDLMSYEGYLEVLGGCAVSLSPLEARPLYETKSDAKFLDAARASAVTLASPTVYDRTLVHGENGLLARELADWPRLLGALLDDEDLRRRLARRAWEAVRDGRMFAHQAEARRTWYRGLWDRREALNAALRMRVPGLGG